MRSRFASLVSTLVRTGGAAGVARALPLFGGIGVVAEVLFGGPNGLRARSVIEMAHTSPAILLVLWLLWIFAITPVARAVLTERTADFLRVLPIPRGRLVAVLTAILLVLQAPWGLLWGAGAGPLTGLSAAVVGAGVAALVVARPSCWRHRALAAPLFIGAGLLTHPTLAGCLALPATLGAVRLAWTRAADHPQPTFCWIAGPAPLSLSLGYHLRLLRTDAAVLVRGVLLLSISGWLAGLAARNTDSLSPSLFLDLSLDVGAVALTIASAGAAFPVRQTESSLQWFLDATGVRRSTRVLASRSTVAAWGAAFAFVFGSAMVASARVDARAAAPAMLLNVLLGACIGAIASESAHAIPGILHAQGGRFVAALTGIASLVLALCLLLGARAVLVLFALALTACVRSAHALSACRREKPEGGALPMIVEARTIRKRFGVRQVLDGVTFSYGHPGVLAIAGENGSGKSTLLKIVCGVVPADAGRVLLQGLDLERAREQALRGLGFVPDTLDLPGFLSVEEWVSLVASLKSAPLPAAETVTRLGVTPILRERLGALSLGQRRRVGLLATTHEQAFREQAADEVLQLADGSLTTTKSAA